MPPPVSAGFSLWRRLLLGEGDGPGNSGGATGASLGGMLKGGLLRWVRSFKIRAYLESNGYWNFGLIRYILVKYFTNVDILIESDRTTLG